jgi:hypothetical protein
LHHLNLGWRSGKRLIVINRVQLPKLSNDDTDLYCRANAASIIASASSQQVVVRGMTRRATKSQG